MKKRLIVIFSVLGLMVFSALAMHAQTAQTIGGKQVTVTAAAINNQTAVACNWCFTCGGDWPVFAGSIRSQGDRPVERGSGCSGSLRVIADASPFLCCR